MSWDETRRYSGWDRIRAEQREPDVKLPSREEIIAKGKPPQRGSLIDTHLGADLVKGQDNG